MVWVTWLFVVLFWQRQLSGRAAAFVVVGHWADR